MLFNKLLDIDNVRTIHMNDGSELVKSAHKSIALRMVCIFVPFLRFYVRRKINGFWIPPGISALDWDLEDVAV